MTDVSSGGGQTLTAGLFGIGLDTYWPQFDGLLPRLIGYKNRINDRLAELGVQVVDSEMVDNPLKAKVAAEKIVSEKLPEVVTP